MADFSFLSDTDDDAGAVEDLLSQAMDHVVLDQVAAINCSGFTDSVLPTHLETRFRNLKLSSSSSFPSTQSQKTHFKNSIPETKQTHQKKKRGNLDPKDVVASKSSSSELSNEDVKKKTPDGKVKKMGVKKSKSLRGELVSSSSSSSNSHSSLDYSTTENNSARFKRHPNGSSSRSKSQSKLKSLRPSVTGNDVKSDTNGEMGSRSKSKTKSKTTSFRGGKDLSSLSYSWRSYSSSPSPPRRTGCGLMWCSPKRDDLKRKKERRESSVDEFLADLNTFSAIEQRRVLKEAMEEQKRISREAAKIVKWAKQSSARMDASAGIYEDDQLSSDNESLK